MSGPRCLCLAPDVTSCNRCGSVLCRWHYADSPMPSLRGDGVVLLPVCLPGCGAAMTSNWVQDCADWARRKRGEA